MQRHFLRRKNKYVIKAKVKLASHSLVIARSCHRDDMLYERTQSPDMAVGTASGGRSKYEIIPGPKIMLDLC